MRPSLEHPFTPIVAEGQKGDNIDFMTFLRILYVKMLVLFTTPTSVLYIFNRNQRRKASSEEQGYGNVLKGEYAMQANLNWLTDPTIFRVNRLDAHSDHICYASAEELAQGESSLRQSLDGQWQFC